MKYSLEKIKKLIKIIYNEHFKCSISMIIYSDDLEKKKILDSIKNIDISQKVCMYDFFSDDLKEYQNLCLDKNSVVVGYNVDKYCDFLLRKGRIQSKCDFYMETFTLVRDSFYLKNEVNLILVLSNEEFDIFISEYCDDFTDYACIKLEYSSAKDDKNKLRVKK